MRIPNILDNSNLLFKPLYKLEEAEKVILGVPFGASTINNKTPVSAPESIRSLFKQNFWSYDFERKKDLLDLKIHDVGNVLPAQNFEIMAERVEKTLSWILEQNPKARLIILGGEHTVTIPAAKILKPKNLLSLDAHPDFNDSYENYKFSIACAMKRVHDLGTKIILRGIRTMSEEEHSLLEKHKIDWKKNLDFSGKADYLSIDIDVLDPVYIETGAPETNGFSPKDVINLIRKTNFKHADIMEWIPDRGYPAVVQILKELLFK